MFGMFDVEQWTSNLEVEMDSKAVIAGSHLGPHCSILGMVTFDQTGVLWLPNV